MALLACPHSVLVPRKLTLGREDARVHNTHGTEPQDVIHDDEEAPEARHEDVADVGTEGVPPRHAYLTKSKERGVQGKAKHSMTQNTEAGLGKCTTRAGDSYPATQGVGTTDPARQ